MATTTLVNQSNRFGSDVLLHAPVTGVALDAAVDETFILPTGFGQILVGSARALITTFSGDFVAPASPGGIQVHVVSADTSTLIDLVFVLPYAVVSSTAAARPTLAAQSDMNIQRVLVRQSDRFKVIAPILAGAGVTGTVTFSVRGIRIQTA